MRSRGSAQTKCVAFCTCFALSSSPHLLIPLPHLHRRTSFSSVSDKHRFHPLVSRLVAALGLAGEAYDPPVLVFLMANCQCVFRIALPLEREDGGMARARGLGAGFAEGFEIGD